MNHLLLALFLGLGGCAAQMISKPGTASQYGPSNEDSRVGTIRYLNQGADGVIKARREDAYRQMHGACKGKYKIVSEGSQNNGGSATTFGQSTFFTQNEYWFINFNCE